MLDTNTISDIARNRSARARERLLLSPKGQTCISSITWGEIIFGLEKRPSATRLRAILLEIISGLEVLPWGELEGLVYGQLRAEMDGSGIAIGSLDLLIAAHAMTVNATLVTRDRALRRVPRLPVENWATELQ